MKLLFILWIFSPIGLWSMARKQQKPCDESNRINKLILLWFAFTRCEDINSLAGTKVSQWKMIKLATFNESVFAKNLTFLQHDLWEFLIK